MDEYINKQELLSRFGKLIIAWEYGQGVLDSLEIVKGMPAADVVPVVHGKWIRKGYVCGENEWKCSNCGETEWRTSSSRMKYCMFCGAKMDLEE